MGYNEQVGERLRSIRTQRGMSLQDVHRATDGEFKAAVLGAYERGERSLSVPRLQRLAACYEVPMNQLLPDQDLPLARATVDNGVMIDLSKIDQMDEVVGQVIDRFLQRIQIQRQDFNGKVLTIRGSDVDMLALMLDITGEDLVIQLERTPTTS